MPESPTVKQKVAAGIKVLDQYSPEWNKSIRLEKLNISSYNQCPLAQISGESSFASGLVQLVRRIENFIGPLQQFEVKPTIDCCSLGFNFKDGENPKLLTEEWIHELIRRSG